MSTVLQYILNYENFLDDCRQVKSELSLERDVAKLKKHFDYKKLLSDKGYCRRIFKELSVQHENKAYGLVFSSTDMSLVTYIRHYLEYGMRYGEKFMFVPNTQSGTLDVKQLGKLKIYDWQSERTILSQIVGDISLIYRLICLSFTEKDKSTELNYALGDMLYLCVKDSGLEVGDFLRNTPLKLLDNLKVGEMTRRAFVFLKAKLVDKHDDMRDFLSSKFYYEFTYVRKDLPNFVKECVSCKFQGIRFIGYLISEENRETILLDITTTNRSKWYYCYSILQRLFAKISQSSLDERLVENTDLQLPLLSSHFSREDIMRSIGFSPDTQFYKAEGHVIHQVYDVDQMNIPVIVRPHAPQRIVYRKAELSAHSAYTIDKLDIKIGSMSVMKLPFGHFKYSHTIDLHSIACESIIFTHNIDLGKMLKYNIIDDYLKCKFSKQFSFDESKDLLESVYASTKKLKPTNLNELFNIDIMCPSVELGKYKLVEGKIALKDRIKVNKVIVGKEDIVLQSIADKIATQSPSILDGNYTAFEDSATIGSSGRDLNLTQVDEQLVQPKIPLDFLYTSGPFKGLTERQVQDYSSRISTSKLPKEELSFETLTDFSQFTVVRPVETMQDSKEIATPENEAVDTSDQINVMDISATVDDLEEKDDMIHTSEEESHTEKATTLKISFDDFMSTPLNNDASNLQQSSENLSDKPDIKNTIETKVTNKSSFDDFMSSSFTSIEPHPVTQDAKPVNVKTKSTELKKMSFDDFMASPLLDKQEEDKPVTEINSGQTVEVKKSSFDDFMSGLSFSNKEVDVTKTVDEGPLKDTQVKFNNAPEVIKIEPIDMSPMEKSSKLQDLNVLQFDSNVGLDLDSRMSDDKNLYEMGHAPKLGDGISMVRGDKIDTELKENYERKIESIASYSKVVLNEELESLRNADFTESISMGIFDEALLDGVELQAELYDSSSSSSSSDEQKPQGLEWFQMQPNQDIHQQLYGFDKKCREGLVSIKDYLLTCIVKPDITKVLTKISDANKLMLYLSHIMRHFEQYKEQTTLRAIFKSTIWAIKNYLHENRKPLFLGKQKAICYYGKEITFLRCKAFENQNDAKKLAASSPNIRFVKEMLNARSQTSWVSQELQQSDYDAYVISHELTDPFEASGSFCEMLNMLFPTLQEFQDDVFQGSYDF